MKAWRVKATSDISGFQLVDADVTPPSRGEASVRLLAAALNYRDVIVARGQYPVERTTPVIPMSDACWQVVSVGEGVTRVKPGDRAINTFTSTWMEGPLERWMWATGFGAQIDGVLTQQRNLPAESLVVVPDSLTDEEAATLPCAAVTAWNALFNSIAPLKAGQTVLTLGTGGVSVFAIQLAKAAGARIVATSSSDAKLKRARELGADILINYTSEPNWEKAVMDATGGVGADVVVEVGGPGTLEKSIASVRTNGRVVVIGMLADPTASIRPMMILGSTCIVHGIMVGNRRHTEELVAAITTNGIKPVIDKVYGFADAPTAFRELSAGRHFGKLAIKSN